MMKMISVITVVLSVVAPATIVSAQELTGAQLELLVSGNTVSGTMAAGGPYTEFYLPDGTLRGSNYDGRWGVDGDTLCFVYDAASPKECWGARMSPSGELLWLKNGFVDGSGTIQPGNASQF